MTDEEPRQQFASLLGLALGFAPGDPNDPGLILGRKLAAADAESAERRSQLRAIRKAQRELAAQEVEAASSRLADLLPADAGGADAPPDTEPEARDVFAALFLQAVNPTTTQET